MSAAVSRRPGELHRFETCAAGDFHRLPKNVLEEDKAATGILLRRLREQSQRVLSFTLRTIAAARLHTRRSVEQDHHHFRRAARRRADPSARERPRHRPNQKQQHEHATSEQQILPNLRAPRCRPIRLEQKDHRRPRHGLVAQPVQQMNDDRQQRRRQHPKHPWLEVGHALGVEAQQVDHGEAET